MEPNIQELGNQATQAIQNQYPSIQLLRDTLVKKFASTENPLIAQRETALANFLASPEEALHKFSQPMNVTIGGGQAVAPGQNPVGEQVTVPNVYRSPSQQRALYSREVANKFAPLSTLNDLLMLQSGGVEGILSQTNDAIKSDIEAKKYKFDAAYKLAELNQQANGVGTLGGRQTNILNQVAIDAQSGMTLKDIMKKYSTQAEISPEDVLRVYNSNSVYGAAKEKLSDLTKYGIKDTRTAEEKNREVAVKPALAGLARARQINQLKKLGPQNALSSLGIKFGGLGVDPDVQKYDAQFEYIRQVALKAFQGGRLSDQDYQRIIHATPRIIDTPERVELLLDELEGVLNDIAGNTSTQFNEQGGTTVMTSPDGQKYNVPNNEVKEAQSNGWR